MKKYNIFIFLVVTICFFSNNVLASKVRPSWLTISDERFATEYRNLAFSNNIEDQSEFAWMLFARLNQPISKDISYRVWELWPDNSTTFSLKAKKIENSEKFKKERNGPALQTIKAHLESFIISSPKVGEEVTRNFLSYNYIINNQLNSRAGIKRKFEKTDYQVDFPVGAIEIKADWEEYEDVPRNKLSYYIKDKAGKKFSLVGLHIMMKVGKKPKDAFTSEEPSWFWTTFEFDYNSGLTNARKLISYSDALPIRKRTQLLQAANLDDTNFINYSSNGTQIRFSDTKNTNIILGNTKMEDFAGNPNSGEEKKTPEKWVSWVSSCHTCHATASVNPNLPIGDLRFFYPFTVQTGTLPVEQLQGYRDLDFIWSIPFRTLKP